MHGSRPKPVPHCAHQIRADQRAGHCKAWPGGIFTHRLSGPVLSELDLYRGAEGKLYVTQLDLERRTTKILDVASLTV